MSNPARNSLTDLTDFGAAAMAHHFCYGHVLIPLSNLTKKPLIKGWRRFTENSVEQLTEWGNRFPNAMPGILTGEPSGIFLLDLDKAKSGYSSLHELQEKHGALPATLRVKTPNGGEHFYFRMPRNVRFYNRASDIAPGLDTRATGGYVAAPESKRSDGKTYTVVDGSFDDLAEVPPWLAFLAMFNRSTRQRLAERNIRCAEDFAGAPLADWPKIGREILRPTRTSSPGALTEPRKAALETYVRHAVDRECEIIREATEGSRDSDLYASMTRCRSVICGAEREGLDTSSLEVELFNQIVDAAAIMGGEDQTWDEDECERKWESLLGGIDPRDLSHVGLDAQPKADARDEFSDVLTQSRLRFPRDIDPLAAQARDRNALIRGLLYPGGLAMLYGQSGSGKSYIALSMTVAIASKPDWYGLPVKNAPVLYVVLEGQGDFDDRVEACKRVFGDTGNMFAMLVPHVSLARNGGDAGEEEIVKAADELQASNGGLNVGLIVIDTKAQATPGDDENSTQDTSKYISRLANISRRTGATILTVHHENSLGGVRGNTSFLAACDLVLHSANDLLQAEKIKGKNPCRLLKLGFTEVQVGTRDDGTPINSAVLNAAPLSPETCRPRQRPKPVHETTRALRGAFEKVQRNGVASVSAVKEEFLVTYQLRNQGDPEKAVESRLRAFRRALGDPPDDLIVSVGTEGEEVITRSDDPLVIFEANGE